jgi:hypothetical protein
LKSNSLGVIGFSVRQNGSSDLCVTYNPGLVLPPNDSLVCEGCCSCMITGVLSNK